jgi:hypothetical protein
MLDALLDALTGRRLGGALFVLAGLVVAGVVLWPGGDRAGGGSRTVKVQPVRIVSVPQLGLAFAYPSTWSRTVSGRVIRLRAPHDSAAMTFSSPVDGRHTDQVVADARDALRRRYAPATIVESGPAKLGARKATSFELEGIGADDSVRVLVVAGSTAYRTYVVTLITPSRPSATTLAQAQQVLATVRLTRPAVLSKR